MWPQNPTTVTHSRMAIALLIIKRLNLLTVVASLLHFSIRMVLLFFLHKFGGDIHPKQIKHISNDIDLSGWDYVPNRYYK